MKRTFSYQEIMRDFGGKYILTKVAERDEYGVARRFQILETGFDFQLLKRTCQFYRNLGADVIIIPALDTAGMFHYELVNGELTEIADYTPSDAAEFFRTYYPF